MNEIVADGSGIETLVDESALSRSQVDVALRYRATDTVRARHALNCIGVIRLLPINFQTPSR